MPIYTKLKIKTNKRAEKKCRKGSGKLIKKKKANKQLVASTLMDDRADFFS